MTSTAPVILPPLNKGRGWDFATHKRYGYLGGDDYEVPTSTPITAVAEGIAQALGTVVKITRPDGTSATLRHVFPSFKGTKSVKVGDVIAKSGADGGKWPHWESANAAGVRQTIAWLVAQYGAALAAANAASSAESGLNYVRRIARYLNGRVLGNDTAAATTGIRGPVYWTIMQRAGKRDGLYGKGYIVNGIPGPRTRELEKHYASIAK